MKKLGLGIIGFVLVAAIYYITSGASQLTIQMKEQVDADLATIQTQGFAVEGREMSEKKEHFVLSIEEPKKVASYLTSQGAQVSAEDIEALKGMKIGIDVAYLADAYSAASFDMYPVALPTVLTSAHMDADDKKALEQIQKMIEKKAFLVHVDVNKLGTGFKGYMKDINEVVEGTNPVTISMTSLKFNGDLENEKLKSIKQTLKNFGIHGKDDEINIQLNNLKSNYKLTGDTSYDYDTGYTIEEIIFTAKNEFNLRVNHVSVDSDSKVKNNLASITAQTKIDSIHFTDGQKTSALETLSFNMKADNFDMQAIEKLETIDPNNEKELLAVFQQLISHGIHFEIPNFSVKQIEFENQKLDGFKLTSSFEIDKSLDLSTLEQNPMAAIGAMDANLNLALSNQLFGLLAQQPQAVMAMMLFQPKDVNGQKVYKVELKGGKVTVNDRPVM
ncbi:MAG: DUF945 family protein [Epsilonproteobacteria bacterium]|nr:DUF945 family protein [Campylobacterota bacterium]